MKTTTLSPLADQLVLSAVATVLLLFRTISPGYQVHGQAKGEGVAMSNDILQQPFPRMRARSILVRFCLGKRLLHMGQSASRIGR